MFTGKELADYCEEMYAHRDHWCYWYGTYGNKCTLAKYNRKSEQYYYPKYDHYKPSRKDGYMDDIEKGRRCADCVGMIKSFFWTGNQLDTDPKYETNSCPDKSADGMFKLCKVTGDISTIPDVPGLVVWTDGHIGVYVGGGYTVEMKGFSYDCRRNKVKSGPWKKWGMLPSSMIAYDDMPQPEPIDDRDMKRGDISPDVRRLQENLIALGFDCGSMGADGDFGKRTEMAVKAFQRAYGVEETGVYDAATRVAMDNALVEHGEPEIKPTPEPTPDPQPEPMPVPDPEYRHVLVTGGRLNVRSAPGVESKDIGTVRKGDVLVYQGVTMEADGRPWFLVIYDNQNGWISSKYSQLAE